MSELGSYGHIEILKVLNENARRLRELVLEYDIKMPGLLARVLLIEEWDMLNQRPNAEKHFVNFHYKIS